MAERHPLSLHQIVAPDLPPDALVREAARLGCRHVCLWTQPPPGTQRFPVVGEDGFAAVRAAMDETGVSAYAVTSFPLTPACDVDGYAAALDRGRRLGASYASVQVFDDLETRAADTFGRLAELAAAHGLVASIEYMGFDQPGLLDRSLRFIAAAGRGAISIDPLHIVRSRTSLEALRAVDCALIGYVQLCDGPLAGTAENYPHESAAARLAPGEGEFPLAEIVALLPRGRPVSLEVPNRASEDAGVPASERCEAVVAATRQFLSTIGAIAG